MKNYKKAAVSIAFLTMIFSAGIYASFIKPKDDTLDKKTQYEQAEVLATFEDNDYSTWKKLISKKSKIGDLIDQTEFNEFIIARSAARSGDYDKAVDIATKLEEKLKDKIGSALIA